MRIVGERITFKTTTADTYDWDGRLMPGKTVRVPVDQCVFVPRGATVSNQGGVDYSLATTEASILTPNVADVQRGASVQIRGKEWTVSGEPVHHRSAFGTGRGGTEIPVTLKEVGG